MIMLMFNLMTKKRIKLNTTIINNGCVHTPADCKVIKCPFNRNKVATIKNIKNIKFLEILTMVSRKCSVKPIECSYSKMFDLSLLTGSLSQF